MNDEKISKIKSKLSNALKDDKIKKLIIVLCIVGIGLIFISTFIGGRSGSESKSKKASQNKDSYTDLSEYKDSIQDELSKIISKIDGVGKAEVFLTLDNSSENVYAVNQKQSTGGADSENANESIDTEFFSLRNSDGSEEGMLLKIIEPDVRGVLIVCDGGDNSVIQERVLDAVTKSLNISSARVCITKLSQQTEE